MTADILYFERPIGPPETEDKWQPLPSIAVAPPVSPLQVTHRIHVSSLRRYWSSIWETVTAHRELQLLLIGFVAGALLGTTAGLLIAMPAKVTPVRLVPLPSPVVSAEILEKIASAEKTAKPVKNRSVTKSQKRKHFSKRHIQRTHTHRRRTR